MTKAAKRANGNYIEAGYKDKLFSDERSCVKLVAPSWHKLAEKPRPLGYASCLPKYDRSRGR